MGWFIVLFVSSLVAIGGILFTELRYSEIKIPIVTIVVGIILTYALIDAHSYVENKDNNDDVTAISIDRDNHTYLLFMKEKSIIGVVHDPDCTNCKIPNLETENGKRFESK